MTINKQSASYKIAHTMYLSLGGDPEKEFTSVEEIYQDIDQLLGESGDRVTVEPLKVELITNGTTVFDDANITGYKPVEVSVNVDVGTAYEDGYNTGYGEGYTQGETTGYNNGYAEGFDGGVADQKSKLESISITENGTYNREDGYNEVKVSVQGKLEVPFEEIGYPTDLKDKLNNELNSKPFSDLEYSKSLYDAWNPTTTSAYDKYKGNNKLVYCPLLYTGNVTNMASMLRDCISLTTVPLLNTRKVTDLSYMFYGCSLLTDVPLFNTSNAKNMSYMFYNCSSLTTIPLLDMSSVTNMGDMFSNCSSLTTIPLLDTSNVTSMSYMFSSCSKLTSIPQLDTSNVTNMSSMFGGCYQLTTIPLLDMSSVTKMNSIFGYSDLTKLTDLGGFKNLGMQSNITGTNDNYFLYKVPNMTYESAMNIINNLYDRKSAGYSVITLKFASKTLALLSDEEKAIATNKGWIIS